MRIERHCPRCRGLSWLEKDGMHIVHRCLCGMHKIVEEVTKEGMVIHRSDSPRDASLPKLGTKLRVCLGRLVILGTAKTDELATTLRLTTSDTASQLTVLQSRGLVVKVVQEKGKLGGSTWQPSRVAMKLYEIRRGE